MIKNNQINIKKQFGQIARIDDEVKNDFEDKGMSVDQDFLL